jgi:type I restriction-modification system DNA methylase subunit
LNGLVFREGLAPNGLPWTEEDTTKLRIADFACGTGSLLCGAYTEIRRHLETNGVSARKLHPGFIESGLIGCDVMPSATHITASMLSSAFPEQRYKHTKILTLPFGRQPDGSVSLGAIEFLSKQGALSIIETGAKGVGAIGDTETDPWAALGGSGVEDGSFDLVVMNPPFTRLTGGGGKASDIPMPNVRSVRYRKGGTGIDVSSCQEADARHLRAWECR